MSKFNIEKSKMGEWWLLYKDESVICALDDSELSDLASCASSALAEQNSRVMGGCKCDPESWDVAPTTICSNFVPEGPCPSVCANCEHDKACHSTQSTDQEGK